MSKNKYSNGKKVVVITLQYIFVITLAISGFLSLRYLGGESYFTREAAYEKTNNFSILVQDEVQSLLGYLEMADNFEVDNSYNGNKLVDLQEYLQSGNISGYIPGGYGFRLEDLIRWSQEHEIPETLEMYINNAEGKVEKITVPSPYFEDEWPYEELVEKGFDIDPYEIQDSLQEVTNGYILNDFLNYKTLEDKFKSKHTNLKYELKDRFDEVVRSNIDSQELLGLQKKYTYFNISSEQLTIDSNLKISREELYNFMNEAVRRMGDGESISLAIDESYLAQDVFYDEKEEFEIWQPWAMICFILTLISLAGTLVTMIYLSLAAGRKGDDDKIHINLIDKIYTEIAAILFGTLFVVSISAIIDFTFVRQEIGSTMLGLMVLGCLLSFANTFFLSGYLSLIRRMKAKILWSRSITARLVDVVKMGFEHSTVTVKVCFTYSAFLILNLLLVLSGIGGIFLAFLIDMAFGVGLMKESIGKKRLLEGAKRIANGDIDYKIDTTGMCKDNKTVADSLNNIGEGLQKAVDENLKGERLKADLITNVSHDIKTPLTSIINYVDLLKREELQNEKAKGYLEVLENKAQRLKNLTEDLVEASKVSSGNVKLEFIKINFNELVFQTIGEFSEKFAARGLEIVANLSHRPAIIWADGRRMWRIVENLYNNVAKYALEGTRVYVDEKVENGVMYFSIKNISQQALNISAEQLTERFIRGDVSRSTEGSGLGLSIARDLTNLQGGEFDIYLDGDLFKVTITFPIVYDYMEQNANVYETVRQEVFQENIQQGEVLEIPASESMKEPLERGTKPQINDEKTLNEDKKKDYM
jgi:signal transduction histidine kinase